jgi:hypothetical protein
MKTYAWYLLLIAGLFAVASCSGHFHWADQDNPKINRVKMTPAEADRFFADPDAPIESAGRVFHD